jgi:hypothetical protein
MMGAVYLGGVLKGDSLMSKLHRVVLVATAWLIAAGTAAAQVPSQNTQSVNSDVLALTKAADLVVRDLGFTPLAEVTFELTNRGALAINAFDKAAPTTKGSSAGSPILIEVFIGDQRITIQQPALAGRQSKTIKVPLPSNTPKPKCLESRSLRVRVDPQNVISELYEDNNEMQVASAQRACPDLAVASIERDKEGIAGELYRVKVTIINQGNAPSPGTKVWGTALNSAPGLTGWPELNPTHDLPPLQPGEKTSFKIGGSTLSSDVSYVRIILDRFFHIDESDETNNFKEKKI